MPTPARRPARTGAIVMCALVASALCDAVGLAVAADSVEEIRLDAISRLAEPLVFDGLGPVFRQEQAEECGHVALAFALALLGDDSGQAVQNLPSRSLSLRELSNRAKERGFRATSVYGDTLASLELSQTRIGILHLSQSHFVVAWRPNGAGPQETVLLLDPRAGRVQVAPTEAVEEAWTGFAMILEYAELRTTVPAKQPAIDPRPAQSPERLLSTVLELCAAVRFRRIRCELFVPDHGSEPRVLQRQLH